MHTSDRPKSYKFFVHGELASPDTGAHDMDDEFMGMLHALRSKLDVPFKVTSAYRTHEYNQEVSGTEHSPHLEGKAIDIRVSGYQAHALIKEALAMGFMGIGVHQRGPHPKRFVHLDMATNKVDSNLRLVRRRPWVWTY